jgi:transcriptional regulator of acetoin/glycerol metabolism
MPAKSDSETEESDPIAHIRRAAEASEIIPLEDIKAVAIEHAYRLCDGNINKTASKLGVTRSTIYRLLKKYGIDETLN